MEQDKHRQAVNCLIWGGEMPEMSPAEMAQHPFMSNGPTFSKERIIDMLASELETAECRHATALAVNGFWRDAYRALFDYGLDVRRLPSYDAHPANRSSATLGYTKRWAERMRREIKAEVHRHEVGIAVLVASAPAPDPDAARRAAAKRRGRERPTRPLRLVCSNPSPSPPLDLE